MKKRILALVLVLTLCLAFSGCTLDSMRKSHAINTEEGKIVWDGMEYIALPHDVMINAKIDYETQVYVTKPDVPLLLQEIYGESVGISLDGKFLEGWYGQTYCRSDCYDQYKNFTADNVTLDHYCYEYYTEEGRQKDEFRTEILEGYDLKVIRFTNRQINTNFRGVCEYIDAAVKASLREGGGPR